MPAGCLHMWFEGPPPLSQAAHTTWRAARLWAEFISQRSFHNCCSCQVRGGEEFWAREWLDQSGNRSWSASEDGERLDAARSCGVEMHSGEGLRGLSKMLYAEADRTLQGFWTLALVSNQDKRFMKIPEMWHCTQTAHAISWVLVTFGGKPVKRDLRFDKPSVCLFWLWRVVHI